MIAKELIRQSALFPAIAKQDTGNTTAILLKHDREF